MQLEAMHSPEAAVHTGDMAAVVEGDDEEPPPQAQRQLQTHTSRGRRRSGCVKAMAIVIEEIMERRDRQIEKVSVHGWMVRDAAQYAFIASTPKELHK